MRPLLCAVLALSSLAFAEAQSGAPLHNAGRAVRRTGLKVRHRYRVAKHNVKASLHGTKAYVGHKYRATKKAIKN